MRRAGFAASASAALAVAGGAMIALAAGARLRRWETLDAPALRSPCSTVAIDDISLHVRIAGGGPLAATALGAGPPPLLLVHGFGCSTFSFRKQLASPNGERPLLAVDLPGFGLSDRNPAADHSHTAQAARLVALLDRLAIPRAVVLGHSMGGSIALRLAASYPERVAGLVLVAAADPNRRFSPRYYPFLRPILPLGLALLASETRLGAEIARTVHDPAFLTEELASGYLRPLRVRNTGACLLAMLRDVRRDPPVDLTAVTVPTLLLWGESDRIVPLSVGRRLAAALPDARLEVIADAAHLPLEEQPAVCNGLVGAFARSIDPVGRQFLE